MVTRGNVSMSETEDCVCINVHKSSSVSGLNRLWGSGCTLWGCLFLVGDIAELVGRMFLIYRLPTL